MALGVRYRGTFLSKDGVAWRVDILQEGYGGVEPGVLELPADCPLEIEWEETDKLDPVQGSCATLKIISDNDRQYIDLYTVSPGEICLKVYRNGVLYWTGSLDPELYEEPFSYTTGYDVTLTFSDFACLDRIDWAQKGLMTIHEMIAYCLGLCGLQMAVEKLISTKQHLYDDTSITLEEIYVNQENFYDEDGEPKTAREVLEAILQPFGLRIVQKAGAIHIYDLNELYAQTPRMLEWGFNDDAVLGVDKVYNNVKLTFSPYGDAEMMKGTVEEDPTQTTENGTTIYQNYHKNNFGFPDSLEGFKLHYDETHKSNMEISGGAKFFQINSIYSGSDETGVIATYKHGHDAVAEEDGASSKVKHQLLVPRDCGSIALQNINSSLLITCPPVFLGYVSFLKSNYRLRINLDLLFDVRYNPFEQEGNYNDNAKWYSGLFNWNSHDGPYQNMQDWCNFGYIPIKLTLQDAEGNALYHYENRRVYESSGYEHSGKTRWVAGPASWGDAYLCYYDFDDRKSKTGFGGWQKNKQIIGYYRDELPDKWKSIDDGEYVDLPPTGGYLVLQIGSGVHQFEYLRAVDDLRAVKNIYKFVRWIAYKEPSITLCKKNYKEAETEDIEDTAWLNRLAKEELEIATILGTLPQNHGVPNAKGQLFTSNNEAYSKFSRAGVEDRLERLLIGTIYSQYATRHDTISGTAKLQPTFGIFSERATAGKFMLLSEVQNCKEGESTVKMVLLTEEEYQGIEYDG